MHGSTSPAKYGWSPSSQVQLSRTSAIVSRMTGVSGSIPNASSSARLGVVAVQGWLGSPSGGGSASAGK